MNETGNGHAVDLRPIIMRLKEIEKKCDSMGSRNEEFPLMKDRLTAIIGRLEAGQEPGGGPLAYRDMARELFPVAHLFESVGFMSVGKEITHVERALQDLEPTPAAAGSTPSAAPASPRRTSTSSAAVSQQTEVSEEEETEEEEETKEGIPKPVVAAFLVLFIAVAVAATIVYRVSRSAPVPDPTPIPSTPSIEPSPATEATRSPRPDPDELTDPRQRYADALSQAQQAVANGDIDGAIGYLAFAELIDRNDPGVKQIADRIVDDLVQSSNDAADEERWEDAARLTTQARTIAKRFKLETQRIRDAENAHFEMQQFEMVTPDQIDALRASIDRHVDVMKRDGSVFSGWLRGFKGRVMILDVEDDMHGGVFSFTDEVPLDEIEWVRIRED
jgi:hypothetical protein